MTNILEAKQALRLVFAKIMQDEAMFFALDNNNFTPPADGSSWGRFTIRQSSSTREATGNNAILVTGIAFAQIFTALDTGSSEGDRIANLIASAYRGRTLAGTNVTCVEALVREGGPDRSYYLTTAEIQFIYNHPA